MNSTRNQFSLNRAASRKQIPISDGKVIIGSEDGSAYCFGVKAK